MNAQLKNTKLSLFTRIITIICAIFIFIGIFTPIWKIELDAPQYPEGLIMKIHSNKLSGDIEVINGLNHYIGMRTLHVEDFVEFTVLPYIIGAFGLLGLITAFSNRKKMLYIFTALLILFAIAVMVDFYMWEYDYGHNLDPNAPIQVPGMSYQPPLIGFKQLLNFGAYSIPDIGGWLLISAGFILSILCMFEFKKKK